MLELASCRDCAKNASVWLRWRFGTSSGITGASRPTGVESTKNYVNPGHAHQGLDVAMSAKGKPKAADHA